MSVENDPRFPIGPFRMPETVQPAQRVAMLSEIAQAPSQLREAVAGLSAAQLDAPYREGGWSRRQVVHHLPDSHMNSFVRFKLALTEECPTIRPYDESKWAELEDATWPDVETSITLLDALHRRWVFLLRSLTDAQWARTFTHPDMGELRLDQNLALYAWHGRHHIAHITSARSISSSEDTG